MFNSIEASNQDATPIELYQFRCGPNTWEYCSGERDQVWQGKTYDAIAISNEGVTQSGDAEENSVTVNLPDHLPMMSMLFSDPPTIPLRCICRHRHGNSNPSAPIHFIAELRTYGRREAKMAVITLQPLSATFKRSGSRMSWGRQCPHALYDRNCRVKPTDYQTSFTIDAVSRGRISSAQLAALSSGYLDNGYIEWTNGYGITQRRSIETHRKTDLRLFGRLSGLEVGMSVKAYPGCARTSNDCDNKFNNINNYGGVPQLSGKSPFQGDPIW